MLNTPIPIIAKTDDDIRSCFPVMAQLRPHLIESEFVTTVRALEKEGFTMVFIKSNAAVAAVAGYRMYSNLFMGKHLYVDDLVTDEKLRSSGYGRILISWLTEMAKKNKCHYLHLDSGTHRHRAHRFYLHHGFDITSFHFAQKINSDKKDT